MSSPESLPLTLSPKAHQDFIDILHYTGKTWGDKQLLIYREKINVALQAISGNSQLGHQRHDLPSTHQAYLVGSHIIVYRVRAKNIDVVRILHQRMSMGKQLSRPASSYSGHPDHQGQ
jgi:toxin ParE1/3/4